MSQKKTATGEFLSAREFGEMLDLNRESVYRAIARGELAYLTVGRAIRLPRSQIDNLLAEKARDPGDQRASMVSSADEAKDSQAERL